MSVPPPYHSANIVRFFCQRVVGGQFVERTETGLRVPSPARLTGDRKRWPVK